MQNRVLKIILRLFLALVLLGGLFFGIWLGVNLWPRNIEASLWTEKDLVFSEVPEKNAWDLLPKTEQQIPPDWGDLKENFPLMSLFPELVDEPSDAHRFWDEARKEIPTLSTYLRTHQNAILAYQSILRNPAMVDNDRPSLGFTGDKVFLLLDLHKIAWTFIVDRFLSGDWDAAYGFLTEMIAQDWSWLNTARSLISNMAAAGCFKSDLDLLLLMRYQHKPDNWDAIQKALGECKVEGIQLHRALAFEYLSALSMVDAAVPDLLRKKNWFIRVSFNAYFIRHDLNGFYRQLEGLLKKPLAIPTDFSKQLNDEMKARIHGSFWWFVNPGGKLILSLVTINQADYFKDFYQKKADIFRNLQALLYAQLDETTESQPLPKPVATPEPANLPQDYSLEDQLKKAPDETSHKKITQADLDAARDNKVLLEGIQATPQSFGGKIVGQKIQGLQNGSFFQQLGFEIGDLILAINGSELATTKGFEIFLEKPKSGEDKVDVLLNRDGKFIRIELKLETPPAASPPPPVPQ